MAAARLMACLEIFRGGPAQLESMRWADYGRGYRTPPQWRQGAPQGRHALFRIFHLAECPTNEMEPGRGDQIKMINTALGTEKLDVHLNRLIPGGPRGKVHHHTNSDNVYIVKRGEGTLTIEGETYVIHEDDVVYIPAGMKHGLHNASKDVFEIFEIYAPAGAQFDFLPDE
jgi:mannose-6-phosphate isomerase-like protein (cupin superfamily)